MYLSMDKSCNNYQNKLCFMLMGSSGKFLKGHLSTLFRNSSVTKTHQIRRLLDRLESETCNLRSLQN